MNRRAACARAVFSIVALTAACRDAAPPAEPAAPQPAQPAIVARFNCERATVEATFEDDRVMLAMEGRTITLPRAISASGARYSDGKTTFWNKGTEATFEIDGASQLCREIRDPWRDARERGVDFRAVGQEPGWVLEIDHQSDMYLLYDYAERDARAPAPPPVTSGSTITYDAGRLRAVIEDKACSDVMSGAPYPQTVTVTIDGRELHGCGRPLAP